MIRKTIYIIFGVICGLFLIWLNYLAVMNISEAVPMDGGFKIDNCFPGFFLLFIEGILTIILVLDFLYLKWDDIWKFIDLKDREIEHKKRCKNTSQSKSSQNRKLKLF